MITLKIVLIIQYLSLVFAKPKDPPKVTLPHGGILVGDYMETVSGKIIRSFRGIPYAEPPVGELRFNAPIAYRKWSGERLADKVGNICPQHYNFLNAVFDIAGNEDCLYLNVYVPENSEASHPLSVMFYIHGGGWMIGTGNPHGPEKLLDHNVILVTCNYRLGALGFLATGTKHCPGNNGMKDQQLALRWVNENIAEFGGNPKDITIFGESAGGASVGYHMFSHSSKGLFQKAILQSGTPFDSWTGQDMNVTLARAEKLGKLLNCKEADGGWKEALECLRAKPAADIVDAARSYFEFHIFPFISFTPVVEPIFDGGAFLTQSPKDLKSAPSGSIPIMIGVTSDEGATFMKMFSDLPIEDVKANFSTVLSSILNYGHKSKEYRDKIAAKVIEFYFNGNLDWNKENSQNLINVLTDGMFYVGMNKFLENRLATEQKENLGETYVYLLDQRLAYPATAMFFGDQQYHGVSHGDDLILLFDFKTPNGDQNEEKIRQIMPEMWANFAKFSNPTPAGSNLPNWKPASKFPLEYGKIGSKLSGDWSVLKNQIGFEEVRMSFWKNLNF